MFLGEIDKETLAPSARSMAGSSPSQAPQQKQSPYSQESGGSSYSQLPMPKRYTSASQPTRRGVQGPAPSGPTTLKVGQRVKHPMFGSGTVSAVSGTGQSEKATVLFDNGQRKQLMVAFARLEKL